MNLELLNTTLRNNGFLRSAVVLGAEVNPRQTNGLGSRFYTAALDYSSDDHDLPDAILMKRSLINDRGQSEADFYELMLQEHADLPLPGYFGVLDEHPDRPLTMLFEDLSASHTQTDWPIIPGLSDCEQAVGALASVHAWWWGRVASMRAPSLGLAARETDHLAGFFPDFADYVGESLSPLRVGEYERVFSVLDGLLARRRTGSNTTLVHTDPHFWNFLYPRDAQAGDCKIFDWPLWRTGLAGCDLAYMIALHLYPEHRRRFEPVLLDRYWRVLQESGVDYGRQDVQLDYRIGIIVGLMMPIMEFSWQIPPHDWLPKLEKAFAAYEELDCRELLDGA